MNELERGIELFNRRAYFECHEAWERLWQEAEEPDRRFYGALIQIATALHLRFERGGGKSAPSLLQQALVVLEDYRPEHRSIDVERLYGDLMTFAERVTRTKDGPPGFVDRWLTPRIRVV